MKMNRTYIELHTHLDGAITVDIANRLVQILGKDFAVSEDILSVSRDCRNLEDFLNCFSFPLSLLQTRECICEAVFMEQEAMKKEGGIYAEIRFAPQLHTKKGLSQREMIEAALKGLRRSDLPCNLILCCMRGADVSDANNETVRLAEEFLVEDDGVVAIDLAGAEGSFQIVQALAEAAEEFPGRSHIGVLQCKDSFYGQHDPDSMPVGYELKDKWDAWIRCGALASEMESAALFIVGSVRKVRVGSIMLVLGNQTRRALGMEDCICMDTERAIQIAVQAVRKLIRKDKISVAK